MKQEKEEGQESKKKKKIEEWRRVWLDECRRGTWMQGGGASG